MFDLTGRKALVTGATGGIGEEIARALHAQGAIVGLHGTRREKLEALAAELGGDTKIFAANLTDRAAVKELAKTAEAELGGVDILVNNAGITNDGLMMRMSDEDWDKVIDINLNATFVLTRELCGPMMKRRYGRVVNISSVVAAIGNPGQANYCASKAGMEGFTKAFAAEVASRNIMANCVSPGFIDTKRVGSGLLMQTADDRVVTRDGLRVVTKLAPTDAQFTDLLFAWKVAKFVKSNAIVYAKDHRTIGVGAGQMSRVYSARIAGIKATDAGLVVPGSVMASDAFFPFRDGIDAAAEAGIKAVIQPGGSMRDAEVIAAADEHGIAMVFTGVRHFRH